MLFACNELSFVIQIVRFQGIRWLAFSQRTLWSFHRQITSPFCCLEAISGALFTKLEKPWRTIYWNYGFIVKGSLLRIRFSFLATVNGVIEIDWLDKQTNERFQVWTARPTWQRSSKELKRLQTAHVSMFPADSKLFASSSKRRSLEVSVSGMCVLLEKQSFH